jgi:uncharacterized protein
MLRRDLLIPSPNGGELAADLYTPTSPGPHPTLVSLYPYRKDDIKGVNSAYAIQYFVQRGYAHLLVDLTGLGSSSGASSDAMSYQHQAADGAAVVEWAAAQPWCDGNVGMWGISYGGITCFQTASLQPPHLRAIVPIYACFDVYSDWFYPGGCFSCLAISTWASQMLAMQLAPPMFHDQHGRWYTIWRERLERSAPYLLPWQEHPTYDEFWQDKTIPIESITAPTFLIGGWRDLFPEAMTLAYEKIQAPRKLWMGPWPHISPDASPTAAVEYLPAMERWFNRFLRDEPNGVDEEPPVTIYVQGAAAHWRNEEEWPISRAASQSLFFRSDGVITPDLPEFETAITYDADPTLGVQAGLWDPRGTGLGLPLEQSPDDSHSVTFTTEPLSADLEITGSPEAMVTLAMDEGDDVNVVVKLCDVHSDHRSELITTGWLKFSHYNGHNAPESVPLGEYRTIPVKLWSTSYNVPAGHRLRVSISCSDFPRIWPTERNPKVRILTGGAQGSHLRLASTSPDNLDGPLPTAALPGLDRAPLTHEFTPVWRIERDLVHDHVTVVSGDCAVMTTPGTDGKLTFDILIRASVSRDAPHGAVTIGKTEVDLEMPTGETATVSTDARITQTGFVVSGTVRVGGSLVFEKTWRR